MQTATQLMVKAGDLRVGNWLYTKSNNPMDGGNPKGEYVRATPNVIQYPSFYEPIPLTPEIWAKCDYEEMSFGYFSYEDNKVCLKVGDSESRDLKYLHEFQNFYFALTGTELTINL